jgi:hypothetical protein
MTTANTEEEVLCEDGATRPLSVCVQDHAGRWHDAEECVDVDGTMYNMSDALICYVETREEWYLRDDCIRVGSHWEHENDAFYCYMCSRGCSDADSCTDPNGASICERCYDYNVCSCNNCG